MKILLLALILFVDRSMADVLVECGSNCSPITGTITVSSTSSQTSLKVSPNPLEPFSLSTIDGVAKKRIVIDVDDSNEVGPVTLDVSAKMNSLDNKAYDANNSIVIAGHVGNITVNTSGYTGANGFSSSQLCYQKIMDGSFDSALSTGSSIKTNYLNRRSLDPALPVDRCDSVDISFIESKIVPSAPGSSVMCSAGYIADASANASTTFQLKRIAPKRACINNPTNGRQCRFRRHAFLCGHGFGSAGGARPYVTAIAGSNWVLQTFNLVHKRVYAPFYNPGKGTNPFNTYGDFVTYVTAAPTNVGGYATKVDGWVEDMVVQTPSSKPETYYYEKFYAGDCSDKTGCTVTQFRQSTHNFRAHQYCLQQLSYWNMGIGWYGATSGDTSGGSLNWVSGWPYTSPVSFYLGLEEVGPLISNSNSESCEQMGVRLGYSTNYSSEDLGPAIGTSTTWIPQSNTCSAGYANGGVYNDYSTCTDSSTNGYCDGAGDEDLIPCSSSSCSGGKMMTTTKDYSPIFVTLGQGESGANHGSAYAFVFNMDGSFSSLVNGGSDGNAGSDDLNVSSEVKICKMVEDEDSFDALSSGKSSFKSASYRSVPRIFIENVNMKSLSVLPVAQVKKTYQSPKTDQNRVFTHVDNNVRKLILRELQ